MKTRTWLWAVTFLLCFRLMAQENLYKIVVNSSNPVSSLSREKIGDFFLKKVVSWENGESVNPVDLTLNSPIRRQFSKEIFGRDTEVIGAYWNQKYFAGLDAPPPMKKSDMAVLETINNDRNAIGYVSMAAPLDNYKVKVLLVSD